MVLPLTPTKLTTAADIWRAPAGTLQDQWVQGLDGNDVIAGGDGADRLEGGAGNDTLTGGLGRDTLDGGAGDDQFYADLTLTDGNGHLRVDQVQGGDGYDTLTLTSPVGTDFFSVSNIERVNGSEQRDVLDFVNYSANGSIIFQTNTPGSDPNQPRGVTVYARGGNDSVSGTLADDRINGGDGADQLNGNYGNDTLVGGAGDDYLIGSSGDDVLRGEGGFDVLSGGTGDDTFYASSDDAYIGGAGYDTLRLDGLSTFVVDQVRGIERVVGSTANDVLDFKPYFSTSDALSGPWSPPVSKPLDTNSANGVRVDAGAGNDRVSGTTYGDKINGGDGNDEIYGNSGNDTLNGGAGQDILGGGDGNDTLRASAGQDFLSGGAGADRFDLRGLLNGSTNQLVIEDFNKAEDIVDLRGLGLRFQDFEMIEDRNGGGTLVSFAGNTETGGGKYAIFNGLTAADITADMFLT